MSKNSLVSLWIVILATLIMSCSQDVPQEDLLWESQVTDDYAVISITTTNITDETIEVKATVHSVGAFVNKEDVLYGFVWFPTEYPIDVENIPDENKITIGTIGEDNSFTFRTTLSDLNTNTHYNVCTFVSAEADMMFGEEITVVTL